MDRFGSAQLFAYIQLKLLKHEESLPKQLRGRSSHPNFHHVPGRFGKVFTHPSEKGKGKGKGKGNSFDKPLDLKPKACRTEMTWGNDVVMAEVMVGGVDTSIPPLKRVQAT